MRRSLTLIELIFSMVIVALTFTIFPKLIKVAGKSSKITLKEEAMYNAVALMGLIQSTAWDENNTKSDDILIASNGDKKAECAYWGGDYRIGGFVGSRNCAHKLAISFLGSDSDDSYPDDMDDFSDVNTSNYNDSRKYRLKVKISYVTDPQNSFSTETNTSTNTKLITISVEPYKKSSVLGSSFTALRYWALNIGQIRVNRIPWR